MPSIFDQMTMKPKNLEPDEPERAGDAPEAEASDNPAVLEAIGQYTSRQLKNTAQELLKFGLLEADKKPNLYQLALTQQENINQILEPLDLRLRVDDIRGLAFLVVAEQMFSGEDDDWSHPLIRRQRLTLEQSLLVAILRQYFVVHEQEAGLGASEAIVVLDELLPQLQLYLGETGSDAKEQKRLRNLLENLKSHGIVSDIDVHDQITIRPLITHLANPENLKSLLRHFREQSGASRVAPLGRGDNE